MHSNDNLIKIYLFFQMVNMDSWMQTDMDRILLNEVIEREWLDHMPFLHVRKKEWRSLQFWGSGAYLFKNITWEEWEAQPSPKPRERHWEVHPSYNPWPWTPGIPTPEEVAEWSDVNGVTLTEAELQAYERYKLTGHF